MIGRTIFEALSCWFLSYPVAILHLIMHCPSYSTVTVLPVERSGSLNLKHGFQIVLTAAYSLPPLV
jgi:hypothetical protein